MGITERIRASFTARVVIPGKTKHYRLTADGRKIAAMWNIHTGKRCFLIGNGPSLTARDLTLLHERGEITFGFNRIYHIFPETPWRPDYYLSQDEKMLAGSADAVAAMNLPVKLIPAQALWYHGIEISGVTYFNILPQPGERAEDYGFSADPAAVVYNSTTCLYSAAQFAVWMGFSEIILLGVDHRFRVSRTNNGEIYVDPTVRDYFTEKYNPDADKLDVPNLEKSTTAFEAMKKACDARGIRVLNATRGGALEVFPRVEFDALIGGECGG